jgi:hypothetical protein
MVEERLAGLEADGHAGAVDFHQDVVDEVRDLVVGHHPLGDVVERQRVVDADRQRLRARHDVAPLRHQLAVERVRAGRVHGPRELVQAVAGALAQRGNGTRER